MLIQYFAYGSNLSTHQMFARTGKLKFIHDRSNVAVLPNYQLAFNMLAEDGQFYANIVTPGLGVYGVIYSCSQEDIEIIDRYETGYARRTVNVETHSGQTRPVVTYIANEQHTSFNHGQPALPYLQTILVGARKHGLPKVAIRQLENIAAFQA